MLNPKGNNQILGSRNKRQSIYSIWSALENQLAFPTFWSFALLLWLTVLIITPIGIWTWGEMIFPRLATFGVLTQTGVVIISLAGKWSFQKVIQVFGLVAIGTWGIEFLGQRTGFPFGDYYYTQALQPQILQVPVLIPLAWFMMLVPSWAVSEILLQKQQKQLGRFYPLVFSALSGLAITAWDLYLDPQMVSKDLWQWNIYGGFFGIPWSNYVGWWLTGFGLTLLIHPEKLPQLPLLMIYSLTWIFQAIGLGLFWGQMGPALAGFLAMGSLVFMAFHLERRNWQRA